MSGADRTVLVLLDRPAAAPAQLAAATWLTRLLGGARLAALAVRVPAVASIMPTEDVLTAERQTAWDAAEQARLAALRQACATAPAIDLRVADGSLAERIATEGRHGDYLVVARPERGDSAGSGAICHAALFATGRPVLVVPAAFSAAFGRRIAVAFRADGRAEQAVLAALPLLRRAERIDLFGEAAMPELLIEQGIAATPCTLPPGDFGTQLLAAMAETGDDLLVMGAYTRSAWREALLGGVTRHVLNEAVVPVLMQH
jgi:nucleotide-binding universal stress UspA family protein